MELQSTSRYIPTRVGTLEVTESIHFSQLATKIAALTMKVKPNCYYQISLSELINNNISFIYAGVAGYGIKSIYGDGVVTFI